MPESRRRTPPARAALAIFRARSASTAILAAMEVAPRRHSVGDRPVPSDASSSASISGTHGDSSPRATATWRHTSDSRSASRRL